MGKGDKKSKRGKIILGSFGVRRPHRPKAMSPAVVIPKKSVKPKTENSPPIKHHEPVSAVSSEPDTAKVGLDESGAEEKKIVKRKTTPKTISKDEAHAE